MLAKKCLVHLLYVDSTMGYHVQKWCTRKQVTALARPGDSSRREDLLYTGDRTVQQFRSNLAARACIA